jgi:5-formyltetrahydrofolate cyclo-ligase
MNDPSTAKANLRRQSAARRDMLASPDRLAWHKAIAENALALPDLRASAGPVAAYWPMRSEVDPRPILSALALRGIPTCLPVVVAGKVVFRRWTVGQPLVPAGFGTSVPPAEAPLVEPGFLFVPLLAFDAACFRLGYGKGHYDRVLAAARAQGLRIPAFGLAYGAQRVAAVPVEPHDQQLDGVVTEAGVVRPGDVPA